MKHYPKYKDSGIDWLGEIPQHWEILKGKWLFKRMNRPVRKDDEVVTAFRDGTVTLRTNRRIEGFTNSLLEIGYQGIRKGDLVIHAMDAFAGAIGVSDSDGKSTPVYAACQPIADASPYYYCYLLRGMAQSGYILSLSKGIRERSSEFRFSEFANQEFPVPSSEEQKQIACFLDRKLEQISHFISNKQRLIELLKEQKAAIINRAVTKGLNPHAPMKPSGMEWLGEIPADWEVTKIKYVSSMISKGTTPSTVGDEIIEQGPIRFLKAENILDGTISLNPEFFISAATNETLKRSKLKLNDVLFVIAGATLGKVALVTYTNLPANTNQAVAFIRTTQQVVPEFLIYWFQSSFIKELIWLSAVQSAQPNLSMEDLGNFPIPLPAKTLQQQLLDYLDSKCSQLNQAIAKIEKEIELIQEYRTTLISDAVTGKIDIRDTSVIETTLTTTAN